MYQCNWAVPAVDDVIGIMCEFLFVYCDSVEGVGKQVFSCFVKLFSFFQGTFMFSL